MSENKAIAINEQLNTELFNYENGDSANGQTILHALSAKSENILMCPQGHNPTIGILLCADTDEDVAHYSVLHDSDQLYAAKYLTYMPTKEELRREIEQQKTFFMLQQKVEQQKTFFMLQQKGKKEKE